VRRLFLASILGIVVALTGCPEDKPEPGEPTPPHWIGEDGTGTDTDPAGTTGLPMLDFVPISFDEGPIEVTEFHFIPGTTHELLLLEKDGFLDHLVLDGDAATRLAQIAVPNVYSHLECGLLSLAFDPDFASNGYFYVGSCTSLTDNAIQRLTWTPENYEAIPDSAVEIISGGDPVTERPWHNIGSMGFDDAGVLWALFGEKTKQYNSQDTGTLLGALVRVIPSREPDVGGWEPAPDNPFADGVDGHPAVYAWGLRSPWRGFLDPLGRYWIGDVGNDTSEEINLVTGPGANLGWNLHEGFCLEDCDGFQDPLLVYGHTDSESYVLADEFAEPVTTRAIWIAPTVTGSPGDPYGGVYDGHMFFGDFCSGFMRALAVDAEGHVVTDEHVGHLTNVTSWAQAPDGTLYLSVYGTCKATTGGDPVGGLVRAVLAP
jgi:glucose/arabinose dehydrogenase